MLTENIRGPEKNITWFWRKRAFVLVAVSRHNLMVAIKPKPPFKPVFQVAASREGSDTRILNEPLNGSSLFLVETGES